MSVINWSDIKECELNPEYDLCGKFNGKYVDITRSYSGTWSAMFNGVVVKENISTRSAAKLFIENYVN